MRQLFKLLLTTSLLLLTACSGSNNPLNNQTNNIRIAYEVREALAPARWVFTVAGGESLTSYQWQFSDDAFSNSSAVQAASIEHVFAEPGVYRIRLIYQSADGEEGMVETEVSIGSGSISGTITAALDTLVDVDTRDPDEPNGNNDSFANAQTLSASTRLSGIVDVNDNEDFYQVQLQQFQRLNLQVADKKSIGGYEQVQLQLFMANDQVTPQFSVATEVSTGRLPSAIIVPTKDNYFIKLAAINPSSLPQSLKPDIHSHGNYSLTIEAPINNAIKNYALGEVNIMLKPGRLYQAQGLSSRMDLGRIKTLSIDNAQTFLASQNMNILPTIFNSSVNTKLKAEEHSHWQTLQTIEALASHPDILYAEPNWKRYPSALPVINDPFYTAQWHYNTINVEQAWEALTNRGSTNVIVAVLDTGVLTAHPDLSSNLIAGYDFVDNDSNANDPGDKSINGQRSSFHGTHVAGTIAASAANATGGVGIAPNVKIMPLRVLGQGGGFGSDIMQGVCFAAQLSSSNNALCENSNTASSAADVINLSLGGPGFSNIENELYNAVIAKGIIVIAAAGNESTSASFYPAAYDNTISVSAINRNLEQASYSNFGPTIDVAAPGGDFSVDSGILSTWGDDRNGSAILTYGALQGTSMAAPHVAGVAALMKSAQANLTHNDFLGHLNAGNLTQDLGASGRDDIFGMGLIDAQKSVLLLLDAQQNLTPQILSSNNHLFFDVSQLTVDFLLSSAGVENDSALGDISVQINGASNNNGGSWLLLTKLTDELTGLGTYQASVNRSGLLEGNYQAELVVSSTLNEVDDILLSVQLQVGNPLLSANAGVQYVVIIDDDAEPNADGVLASAGGSAALIAIDGKYSYQVVGLKKGNYTVSTGSDIDLDFVICDAGESCGQYPTLEQPKTITISEEQPHFDINMSVNYVGTGVGSLSVGSATVLPNVIYRLQEQPLNLKTLQKKID
ncbi:MAG: S8 family serine peptidase [Oleispira sp.]